MLEGMRSWPLVALWVCVAGCHSGPPACTGVCTPPTLTRLDLLAGQPGGAGWVDGAGSAAHFADPWTIVGDHAGHLYVADGLTLRAIDLASATVTTLAGTFALPGASDGVGGAALVYNPSGLVFSGGALYFTDTENHTIRKVDVASATVSTLAGVAGMPGTADASGSDARFREPEGLTLDAGGNVYIADTDNNTIRVMTLASGAVTTIAGSAGVSGTTDDVGVAARFSKPTALALDPGGATLWIVDSFNRSVRKLDVATRTVSTLATFATIPQGIAVDGSDLVLALGDHRVVRVATAGGAVTTLAGAEGVAGFVDGAAADARFNRPAGLYNDGAGTLWLADEGNAVVRSVALATGGVATVLGANSAGSLDGTGHEARFFAPQGLTAAGDTLYVADSSNHTLRQVAVSTGVVTTLAGAAGKAGLVDGALADARFSSPIGLALGDGALYVADSGNRSIRRVDLAAGMVTTLALDAAPGDKFSRFKTPAGLAIDGGRLFVADVGSHVIVAIDLAKRQATLFAGQDGVAGNADGTGVHAGFYGPQALVSDGRGHLYVSDYFNDTVRVVDVATGAVTTLAGQRQVQGSSDGAGAAARFYYPSGLAIDGAGDLWVADSFNNEVRHVDLASAAVTTVIGTLTPYGVALGPLPARLAQPTAMALTASGALILVSENALLMAH